MIKIQYGPDADEANVREYSDHVKACAECSKATHDDDLCIEGGILFDVITDSDPTDPGVPQ